MRQTSTKIPWDRYPYPSLHVSVLAEQAYCEKRVDLWLKKPISARVSLPSGLHEERKQEIINGALDREGAVALGTEFHEAVRNCAAGISLPEAKESLKKGRSLTIVECSLQGRYKNFPIMGRADVVCFEGWRATYVIEYKVTRSQFLHPTHHAQLRLYGFLLEKNTFDVRDLILICVFVPPENKDWIQGLTTTQSRRLARGVIKLAEGFKTRSSHQKTWYPTLSQRANLELKLGVFKYDRKKVREELGFFTRFWLGERDPIPTRQRKKCATCLYNLVKRCPAALVPYQR